MPKEETPSTFMLMVHKDFPDRDPVKVLKLVFEKLWKDKGWKEATKAQAESASASASTGSAG